MSILDKIGSMASMAGLPDLPDVPLSLAAPAAVATLAYLNAKLGISYDLGIISSYARAVIRGALRDRSRKWNHFYLLEEFALNPKKAHEVFLVYQGKEWTYRQTYDTALRYGNWFRNTHNVKPGEVVAIDFMNSATFIFIWMGLWSVGALPAFINYNLTAAPLTHCVKVSTARLFLVDDEVRAAVPPELVEKLGALDFREKGGAVKVVFHDESLQAEILRREPWRAPDADRQNQERADPGILIYTSGTTGLPKAAIISWGKLLLAGTFVSNWLGLRKTDRVYTCMPLYHSTAAVLGFVGCLASGTSLAIGHKFSASGFWDDVRNNNATIVQYVGETMRYLLAAPVKRDPHTGEDLDKKHNVRLAFGNGLRPDVWDRVKERYGIATIGELYSATESTSGAWNLSSNSFSAGAIGRSGAIADLILGSSAAIVKLDHDTELPWRDPKTGLCKRMPRGEPGELLYALDAQNIKEKFQGYFNNPGASDTKILRDVLKKGDAWFRTGDVIRYDPEGRWFFSDRIGDTFRWRGENVSTNEVAEVLGSHPEVYETNVYGVLLPHHDGRAGCAALVMNGVEPDAEKLEPSAAFLSSLGEHVTKNLPKYATPLFLRVTRVLEITGNNKQQKTVLRAEGVDPNVLESNKSRDRLYWLRGKTYVPFEKKDWEKLNAGQVKL
ncbi:fatty acid transporter protein [Arthroderma uncinatum]|uniref:fatty acid transporter protein n=1 Tax=Arthroderma uncinatum TaxID=74035 RepID=UPI00144A98E7|nr:fatty acid transporter protein [Arthroderma uncinatum]KAF3482908.1 fatty acid transporter protein [Arthroderma uncinatum]